ncbi:BnaC01g37770D [Brassica napus]|uniref:(rape) hypothetical protein n=2 Tax=Brassica napus TaxID=3708 RepID=A0A078GGC1_BRANA|nr:unnamed protein product [Brassica napus]CDY24197.1 BnaC01g37770D [Brassica napus]
MATSPGNSNPPISIPRRSISVISSNPYRILTIRRLHLTLRPQVRFTINSPTLRRLSPPSHPRSWLSSTITTTVEAPPSRPLEIARSTNIYLCSNKIDDKNLINNASL